MIKNIKPIRLRLELIEGPYSFLSEYEQRMLMRYGESRTGESIVRDILIPSDMPLHNLHYAIQRLFGWQNSHLREFMLPDYVYDYLTKRTVKGWSNLVGTLFQPPSQAEHDTFWDEDYQSGSINVWLKKKYTGPYVYGGYLEHFEHAKEDMQALLDRFQSMEVQESFQQYMKRKEKDEHAGFKVVKTAALIDLTLDEMNSSIALPGGTESLLERLKIDQLLANQGEEINEDELFPVTDELFYHYDFGDDWYVRITKYADCANLLENNFVDVDELRDAEDLVKDKHQPVCIHKEGLSVLDNIGGLGGFANFLGTIYEETDKEEAKQMRQWARSLGWNATKKSIKKML